MPPGAAAIGGALAPSMRPLQQGGNYNKNSDRIDRHAHVLEATRAKGAIKTQKRRSTGRARLTAINGPDAIRWRESSGEWRHTGGTRCPAQTTTQQGCSLDCLVLAGPGCRRSAASTELEDPWLPVNATLDVHQPADVVPVCDYYYGLLRTEYSTA